MIQLFKFLQKKDLLLFYQFQKPETSIVYSVHNSINPKEENIEQLIKEKILSIKLKI